MKKLFLTAGLAQFTAASAHYYPEIILDIIIPFVCLLLAAVAVLALQLARLKAKRDELHNLNALYKTFLDAENNLIYLKDENLKYVFVNKAFEYFFEVDLKNIIGNRDSVLRKKEFVEKLMMDDQKVLSDNATVVSDYEINGRVYMSIKFPVNLKNGKIGVGAQIMDATDEVMNTKQQLIYFQTLVSIGDGVIVVDQEGKIEMINKAAERMTGWTYQDAVGRPYSDVLVFSSGGGTEDPVFDVLHQESFACELKSNNLLISKDGSRRYVENCAAPIMDDMDNKVGVVIVFRDVTEEKKHNDQIRYLSTHDPLTGLYNRRYFEEAVKEYDIEANLPISIIVGDVNGLKLTNDIFGHNHGDILLVTAAEIFRKVCRNTDVIARLGGDEFVILLPRTTYDEALGVIEKIKQEFSTKNLKAIKSSISMGCATKSTPDANIFQIFEQAEDTMYSIKTLERDNIRKNTISEIVKMLHQNSAREEEHSNRVSELCARMGKRLGFPEDEIRKLREAGYLHDIGKIVLGPNLINKSYLLTTREWNEIRRHAIVGYRILNSFEDTLDLTEAVLTHHERWDGKGYPKGLKGEEIPRLARIISIVESYDRMTHDSDNQKARSKEEAISILRQNAGTVFDPELVEVFIELIESDDSV